MDHRLATASIIVSLLELYTRILDFVLRRHGCSLVSQAMLGYTSTPRNGVRVLIAGMLAYSNWTNAGLVLSVAATRKFVRRSQKLPHLGE